MAGEGVGIVASIVGSGLAFGLTARVAGLSVVEAVAFSSIVFAGASQFAAVGALAAGASWPAVILLTALLNARHFLYAAVLAPWLGDRPRWHRAVAAHVLTDEAFALAVAHFRRLGRADLPGYFGAALLTVFVPWNLATLAGFVVGAGIPDPSRLGLDVIFPATMAGLGVGLLTGRQEVLAAAAGAAIGVGAGIAWGVGAGVVAGGVLGPLVAMAIPGTAPLSVPATQPSLLPFDARVSPGATTQRVSADDSPRRLGPPDGADA